MKPLILINFKTYKKINDQLVLAKAIAKVKRINYTIAVSPSLLALKEIVEKTNLVVYGQHMDGVGLGPHTGSISIDELKEINVKGTILNHSERKLTLQQLKETIGLCDSKLKTIVCASTIAELEKIAHLHPTYIAYEPKELIGKNISVCEAKPDIILKAVDKTRAISPTTKLLCGAGIHKKEDLGLALLLRADGILISHAIVQAKKPQEVLAELLI